MVGTQLMVCQAFAILEVIHPLVGLVKTGVMSPLMQVKFMLFYKPYFSSMRRNENELLYR